MSNNNTRLKYLIIQYSNNAVTAAEEQELFILIDETGNEEFEMLLAACFEEQEPVVDETRRDRILNEILRYTQDDKEPVAKIKKIYPPKVVSGNGRDRRGGLWKRLVTAAAILVAIISGTYLLTTRNDKQEISKTQQPTSNQDVAAPNKAKATLTLSDGRIVSLDSLTSGTLANQGNVSVSKTVDGKIIYNGSSTEVAYNTLTNPRGSLVIDMTLGDGSHVWLNAGSSVTYPVSFVGKERKVSMTGEAYFEIAHNSKMPFVVQKNDVSVQVLGTHFNVNAYEDENDLRVTLLEGSVKILRQAQDDKAGTSAILKPGEQGILRSAPRNERDKQNDSEIRVLKNVDVDAVMAWRNGLFEFSNTELPVIMRQVARWYDIEVVYEGKPTNVKFGGGLSMKLPMSKVLKLLEANGLKFKVEGKKVTVIY
jgi:hypothetical protein